MRSIFNRSLLVAALLAAGAAAQTPGTASADITINYGTGLTTYSFVNVSSSAATVVATYYPPGGNTPDLSHTYSNVLPNTRTNVTLGNPDALLPSNWSGSVVLSSDQDVIAVAVTDYTGKGTSANGYETEMVSYGAFNQGDTMLYVPQLQRTSGVNLSTSRLTIQNTTGSPATVYVTFYYGGSGIARPPISLAPYGSVTLRTNMDSDIAPANWSGVASAVVTATQPIVGFAERHWDVVSQQQNWAAGYALLTAEDAATTLYSPAAFRNCVGGTCVLTVAGTFNAYSTLLVQNTTASSNVITITAISRATGLPLTNKIVKTLAPYASYLMNPFNNDNDPGGPLNPLYAEMGGSFAGSAIVESSSPVVGVGFTFNPKATTIQNTAGGYKLLTATGASAKVLGPRFARVCGAGSCADFNTISDFVEFSNAQIINLDSVPVTLTSIEFVKADGTVQFTLYAGNQATYFLPGQSLTLQPGASIAINTRTGGSLDRGGGTGVTSPKLDTIFGTNFQGTIRVNAPVGAKVKAIVTVTRGEKLSDIYNAFNR